MEALRVHQVQFDAKAQILNFLHTKESLTGVYIYEVRSFNRQFQYFAYAEFPRLCSFFCVRINSAKGGVEVKMSMTR